MFSLPTILLAEDDADLVSLLLAALEPDYTVTAVPDGAQAMERLEKQVYDLVLLDITMPGLTGLEVCRSMKQNPRLAGIPVIFLTASEHPGQLEEAFAAGGVDYLSKPIALKELQLRIQTHVRLHVVERALRHQLAQRDLMLMTLSHDLRGPVGAAGGLITRLAKHQALPDDVKALAHAATQAANQSYTLLEDMLTWAQAIGDHITFAPVWLPLNELGAECLELLRPRAEQKDLRMVLGIPEKIQVFADPNLLKSILLNLLSNAIKFTHQGTVTLRADSVPGSVFIHLEDTGKGIPETVISQLEHHQPILSGVGTEGERGTGMGLKICQEFTTYHQGQLAFHFRPGQGSHVILTLPLPEPLQP